MKELYIKFWNWMFVLLTSKKDRSDWSQAHMWPQVVWLLEEGLFFVGTKGHTWTVENILIQLALNYYIAPATRPDLNEVLSYLQRKKALVVRTSFMERGILYLEGKRNPYGVTSDTFASKEKIVLALEVLSTKVLTGSIFEKMVQVSLYLYDAKVFSPAEIHYLLQEEEIKELLLK